MSWRATTAAGGQHLAEGIDPGLVDGAGPGDGLRKQRRSASISWLPQRAWEVPQDRRGRPSAPPSFGQHQPWPKAPAFKHPGRSTCSWSRSGRLRLELRQLLVAQVDDVVAELQSSSLYSSLTMGMAGLPQRGQVIMVLSSTAGAGGPV